MRQRRFQKSRKECDVTCSCYFVHQVLKSVGRKCVYEYEMWWYSSRFLHLAHMLRSLSFMSFCASQSNPKIRWSSQKSQKTSTLGSSSTLNQSHEYESMTIVSHQRNACQVMYAPGLNELRQGIPCTVGQIGRYFSCALEVSLFLKYVGCNTKHNTDARGVTCQPNWCPAP